MSDQKTTDIVARLLAPGHGALADEAAQEIERLRAEVHDLGRLSDTCTYHALGKVCGYCECKRKARKNSQ